MTTECEVAPEQPLCSWQGCLTANLSGRLPIVVGASHLSIGQTNSGLGTSCMHYKILHVCTWSSDGFMSRVQRQISVLRGCCSLPSSALQAALTLLHSLCSCHFSDYNGAILKDSLHTVLNPQKQYCNRALHLSQS